MDIAVDFDDVLFECVPHAIRMANRDHDLDPPIQAEEIDQWGYSGKRTDVIFDYFSKEEFYRTQPAVPGARQFIQELLERKVNVIIASAVAPDFMTLRAQQIMQAFPELLQENIMLGGRKDLMRVDVLLDDAIHNLEWSPAACPVLFDQPWNQNTQRWERVCCFQEFMQFVDRLRGKRILVGPFSGRRPEERCLIQES